MLFSAQEIQRKKSSFCIGRGKITQRRVKESPEEGRRPGFSQQTQAFLGGPEKVRRRPRFVLASGSGVGAAQALGVSADQFKFD